MAAKQSEKDIARLRKAIADYLEWGEVTTWHSRMFDELSEKVYESTNILLSVPTLKRFFGVVNHDGAPSITTLDALSHFIGQENWRVFRTAERSRKTFVKSSRKSWYVTVGFILALVTISLIGNKRPDVVINASEFTFSSEVLSSEYPNSVVFTFRIPSTLRTDSLHIQQYWDPTKTILIKKNQTQATGIYYYPGYFRAKLMADGHPVLEHDLFLKSDGWLGMVEYAPVPKYFIPIVTKAGLNYPEEVAKEVSESDETVISTFHYVDDLGDLSGDNFTLKTTLKNQFDDRWAVCHNTRIYFLGTTGALIIPFSKIGCSSDNNLMLNDVYLSGKENDLSALSTDFSDDREIEINIEQRVVTILIDGEEKYEATYNESIGTLVGMRFRFEGLGEVINYELTNQEGDQIVLQ